MTYSEVDAEIVRRKWGHHVFYPQYGWAAGAIGDALLDTGEKWEDRIPPLNAIVVNRKTRLPGKGCNWYLQTFLGKRRRKLSPDDRRALAEAVQEKVFNFDRWDDVLAEYGMRPLGVKITRKRGLRPAPPRHGGWSTEGESEAHKRLVTFVALHPELVDLSKKAPKGDRKYAFASADRPDVLFVSTHRTTAVEVKSHISHDADLERGVYQCVKYRALLRAEQKARGVIPNGSAVLVTARKLPAELMELSKLLDVRVVVVNGKAT